ncbi:MAG: hypothetical protein PXX83_08230 [Candidatus Nitrosotalea sp.]|nr:hypothetical protein [Candidatus Nitrosotalea sp.]
MADIVYPDDIIIILKSMLNLAENKRKNVRIQDIMIQMICLIIAQLGMKIGKAFIPMVQKHVEKIVPFLLHPKLFGVVSKIDTMQLASGQQKYLHAIKRTSL